MAHNISLKSFYPRRVIHRQLLPGFHLFDWGEGREENSRKVPDETITILHIAREQHWGGGVIKSFQIVRR